MLIAPSVKTPSSFSFYNLCNVTSSSQTNQSQEGVGIMTSAFFLKNGREAVFVRRCTECLKVAHVDTESVLCRCSQLQQVTLQTQHSRHFSAV